MSTLIVGDLHGRIELAEAALASSHDVIFMGDYLDSYDRSPEVCVNTLLLVLEAIEAEPDKYAGLLGNHELSYLYPHMRCSGFKDVTKYLTATLKNRMLSVFQPYIKHKGYLLSHAGVSQNILDEKKLTIDEYLEAEEFMDIGYARGGSSPNGGLYWADWFREFVPVEGVYQIVGHSGYRPFDERAGILEKDGNFNVDCFEHTNEFLLLDDEPTIINLKDL